jgi:hypothetical protein
VTLEAAKRDAGLSRAREPMQAGSCSSVSDVDPVRWRGGSMAPRPSHQPRPRVFGAHAVVLAPPPLSTAR